MATRQDTFGKDKGSKHKYVFLDVLVLTALIFTEGILPRSHPVHPVIFFLLFRYSVLEVE